MSPETAYMITDILKDTITEGTGTNAQIAGLYQAGKTGTSNYTDDEYAKLGISSGVYPDILFAAIRQIIRFPCGQVTIKK